MMVDEAIIVGDRLAKFLDYWLLKLLVNPLLLILRLILLLILFLTYDYLVAIFTWPSSSSFSFPTTINPPKVYMPLLLLELLLLLLLFPTFPTSCWILYCLLFIIVFFITGCYLANKLVVNVLLMLGLINDFYMLLNCCWWLKLFVLKLSCWWLKLLLLLLLLPHCWLVLTSILLVFLTPP